MLRRWMKEGAAAGTAVPAACSSGSEHQPLVWEVISGDGGSATAAGELAAWSNIKHVFDSRQGVPACQMGDLTLRDIELAGHKPCSVGGSGSTTQRPKTESQRSEVKIISILSTHCSSPA
jgi:hypothetical protein